jgi:hypothetical protein
MVTYQHIARIDNHIKSNQFDRHHRRKITGPIEKDDERPGDEATHGIEFVFAQSNFCMSRLGGTAFRWLILLSLENHTNSLGLIGDCKINWQYIHI